MLVEDSEISKCVLKKVTTSTHTNDLRQAVETEALIECYVKSAVDHKNKRLHVAHELSMRRQCIGVLVKEFNTNRIENKCTERRF